MKWWNLRNVKSVSMPYIGPEEYEQTVVLQINIWSFVYYYTTAALVLCNYMCPPPPPPTGPKIIGSMLVL